MCFKLIETLKKVGKLVISIQSFNSVPSIGNACHKLYFNNL